MFYSAECGIIKPTMAKSKKKNKINSEESNVESLAENAQENATKSPEKSAQGSKTKSLDEKTQENVTKSSVKNAQERKAETLKKIEAVLEAEAEELEKAAERLAPDFDYEAEAAELEILEKIEAVLEAEVPKLEEVAAEIEETTIAESDEATESAAAEAAVTAEAPLPAAEISPSKYPKPRYVPKTGIGKVFLRDKHRMTLGATLLLLLLTLAWQGIDYYIPETVNLTYRTLEESKTEAVQTRTGNVGDFVEELKANGWEIGDEDAVSRDDDYPISNDMTLIVAKVIQSTAKIAGTEKDFLLIPGTVEENLEFNNIEYDDDDEIKPALNKEVNAKTEIVVNEVHYKTVEKKEKVEAESKVILDPKLTSGVEQRNEGNDGEGIFTYTYKYVNGKKKSTDKEVKEWITEPHDNELRLGTSKTGDSGTYRVVRTFTANCTAYTSRVGAGGALGLGVHYGTCAVDPTFVSYRSEMWIEGYGYAFANDCGGAVKGNVVDLWMSSTADCIQWGRRNCTAYVLEPVD